MAPTAPEKQPVTGYWGRLPLRRQLAVALLAIASVPLIAFGWLGVVRVQRLLTSEAFARLRGIGELEASQTIDFVRTQRDVVRAIVPGNEHLFSLIDRASWVEPGPGLDQLRGQLNAHLRAKAGEIDGARELLVLAPDGSLLGSSLGPRTSGQASTGACVGADAERLSVGGLEMDGAHEPSLVLTVPVRNPAGELLGRLCARIRFDQHSESSLRFSKKTGAAVAYLVDAGGRVIDRAPESAGERPVGQPHRAGFERWGGARQTWEGRYTLEDGEDALAVYVPIEGLDYGVLVEVPERVALAPLDVVLEQFGALGLLSAVVLGAAAVVISRRLARPFSTLAAAARGAVGGHLGEPVSLEGAPELADLARAFNQMTLGLKASHDELEHRVAARTRDLQAAQDFSETLLNSLDLRVTVIDREFKIIKANRAALRRSAGPVLGSTCHRVFDGRSTPCADCAVQRTFTTGKPHQSERSEGEGSFMEIVEVQTFPVLAADGGVGAVVHMARVVTAEKQIQAQLMLREKMSAFGLMAAGVAHEIGNPLAAIMSLLRLARETPDPARVEKTLELVSGEVTRINGLLHDLVSFARRPRGGQSLVSVNQVVADVKRLLSHDPRARNITIEEHLADNLPGVRAKEDHLVQLLLNLGINALDAMPEGGTLSFHTVTEAGEVVVRVRDSGSGIPLEVQQRLFEPFFTTKEDGRGTGLGLFVSKGIARDLNGKLAIEQTGPSGTVFSVRLPVASVGAQGPSA